MLSTHLQQAGFFSINWETPAAEKVAGTTYVRPDAHEIVRVFIPTVGEQIQVYGGESLFASKLRYCGPISSKADLLRLLNGSPSYLVA